AGAVPIAVPGPSQVVHLRGPTERGGRVEPRQEGRARGAQVLDDGGLVLPAPRGRVAPVPHVATTHVTTCYLGGSGRQRGRRWFRPASSRRRAASSSVSWPCSS